MHFEGDNMMGVKRNNRSAALRILHKKGGMSRKRLAEAIKLTPAAITKIVSELIGEGLVREGATMPAPGAGRREVRLTLVPEARYGLGILIDRRLAILSAVRMDGSCVFSERVELEAYAPAEQTVNALCARLMELAADLPRERLVGVGVALRGIMDSAGRRSMNAMGALSRVRGTPALVSRPWAAAEPAMPERTRRSRRSSPSRRPRSSTRSMTSPGTV